jgi:hypothetical protein
LTSSNASAKISPPKAALESAAFSLNSKPGTHNSSFPAQEKLESCRRLPGEMHLVVGLVFDSLLKEVLQMRKSISLFLLLILSLILLESIFASSEELISGPYKNTFKYDFNSDNKKDDFILEWKIVKDFSYNLDTKTTSTEKYIWYQTHFQIILSDGALCHDDLFSMVESDYNNMIAMIKRKILSPKNYYRKFFSDNYNLNNIEVREIKKEEISIRSIRESVEYYKSNAKPEEIEKELLLGRHIVVSYVRSWYEDIGVIAFSKILGKSIWLNTFY